MSLASRFLGSAMLLLMFMLFGRVAAARERLAVYVVVEGDPALAENLAEVTISKLAETAELELVGPRELALGSRDVPMVRKDGLAACIELPACLAAVGGRARTPRAVLGKLRRDGSAYEVAFALLRTDTFETERQSSAVVAAELGPLISAVQTSVAELVTPRAPLDEPQVAPSPRSPSPSVAFAPAPVTPPPAPPKRARADAAVSPQRKETQWLKYVGFAAAGLSVVAFSAAAVNASAASSPPQGSTRGARQLELDKRKDQATAATALFVSGGGLGAVAVVSFAWP